MLSHDPFPSAGTKHLVPLPLSKKDAPGNRGKLNKNSSFISKVSSIEQGENSGRTKLGAGRRREKLLRKRALPPHPSQSLSPRWYVGGGIFPGRAPLEGISSPSVYGYLGYPGREDVLLGQKKGQQRGTGTPACQGSSRVGPQVTPSAARAAPSNLCP